MRVLVVTSEWPDEYHPTRAPFLVQEVNALRLSDVKVSVYSFRGARNPFNYLKAWFELRDRYRFQQFDLIHAHWGHNGLLAIPSSVALIVTFHGSDLQGIGGSSAKDKIMSKILWLISRIVFQFAKQVIVVSEHMKMYLPESQKICVIPCGIDLQLFKPLEQNFARNQLGLSMEAKYVLFPADPERPVKRYYLAKCAVSLLKKRMSNVEMLVLSGVKHTKVPLYMNACDVLLLTSHHEGSPTVIKEALACNLPIVSVDVGDVRERISNVEGCVLCEDDTPKTIASGIELVLKIGKRISGREKIQDLDGSKIAHKIIEVYQAAAK